MDSLKIQHRINAELASKNNEFEKQIKHLTTTNNELSVELTDRIKENDDLYKKNIKLEKQIECLNSKILQQNSTINILEVANEELKELVNEKAAQMNSFSEEIDQLSHDVQSISIDRAEAYAKSNELGGHLVDIGRHLNIEHDMWDYNTNCHRKVISKIKNGKRAQTIVSSLIQTMCPRFANADLDTKFMVVEDAFDEVISKIKSLAQMFNIINPDEEKYIYGMKSEDVTEILECLNQDKRISAIKMFRTISGLDLRGSKDFIDEVDRSPNPRAKFLK